MVERTGPHRNVILPLFISHMGCPARCVYCNQFRIAGAVHAPTYDTIRREAEVRRRASGQVPELAFYGGSFTALPLSVQDDYLQLAVRLRDEGLISSLRCSTRPDALSETVLKRMAAYGMETIEIGVQSLDDAVLAASGRGHDAQASLDAMHRVKAHGFRCGVQLMTGLPEDTPEKSLQTLYNVLDRAPDMMRIYPTVVIKDTTLAESYLAGHYKPWTLEATIATVARMVRAAEYAGVQVIRIGLQHEENLSFDRDVLAGPMHPAMGELVRSAIWRLRLEEVLSPRAVPGAIWEVRCHRRQQSQLVGQHASNIRYFKDTYGIKVVVKAHPDLAYDRFEEACLFVP